MRVRADAHHLPFAAGSVAAVISNPPYDGNGIWDNGYWKGVARAVTECRRVLRSGGSGWFLLRDRRRRERWLTFDEHGERWAHFGRTDPPAVIRPRVVNWGTVPEADLVPLILEHTRPGDIVLDPFAGRGGIPKLAARLGRVALGVDIDMAQLEMGRRF